MLSKGNKTTFGYWLLLAAILLLPNYGCHKNTKKVDVSNIQVQVNISRLEKDLYSINPDSLAEHLPTLLNKYPDFLPFYTGRMMGLGDITNNPDKTTFELQRFLKDTTTRYLMNTTILTYDNLDLLQKGLEDAFKHYKYYYPNKSIPKVITYVSYFGYSNITYDTSILGIGLDMYLGKDFDYPPTFPEYIRQTLTKDYMLANSMKVLATMQYNLDPTDNKLITSMIDNGKQLYFTDLMLPDEPDYLKIGYQKKDIEWCHKNEPEIWQFFVQKDLLYSTDADETSHYVSPGPSTSGMPQESPGNVGSWVGWQIVRMYMDKHPETTIDELMKMDAQKILNLSQYKPKHSLL